VSVLQHQYSMDATGRTADVHHKKHTVAGSNSACSSPGKTVHSAGQLLLIDADLLPIAQEKL
jgi:hypothetical protein